MRISMNPIDWHEIGQPTLSESSQPVGFFTAKELTDATELLFQYAWQQGTARQYDVSRAAADYTLVQRVSFALPEGLLTHESKLLRPSLAQEGDFDAWLHLTHALQEGSLSGSLVVKIAQGFSNAPRSYDEIRLENNTDRTVMCDADGAYGAFEDAKATYISPLAEKIVKFLAPDFLMKDESS